MSLLSKIAMWAELLGSGEAKQRMLIGRQLAWRVRELESINEFADVEFSVFSQFGDDGIIQWLIHRLPGLSETFVEFGVGCYQEANTRFLLVNNNWRGLVLDSSRRKVHAISRDTISLLHDLQSVCAVVTAENIDQLMLDRGFEGDIGLLHIDIDGNDYWVWRGLTAVRPGIAIIEYNSVFGVERAITVPYDPKFSRAGRFGNLYFGTSLPALCDLAQSKGYDFVGSNSAGNNAYFIRSDLPHGLKPLTAAEGYVVSKFVDSRDAKGRRTHLRGEQRLAALRGAPVVNTRTGAEEQL
ncbi:FkbM family methyltransferase [Mycobacterium kansasii]|uniref:Methyltransferase FkbM domain protein n=4 Tax=Mycobacterium kansasii TaxID=1768 RepID=A0A1V3XY33_MYCKA|nr:FkbM family methyltransferase [Mycobacterium kansasii]EUA04843.1 methyltransferase FkbM domain protein [Mycobacterium kansasii 824]AGZ52993.1 NADH dehydrogenase [Mycobacterium kansasii ATCC 12478]ARG60815.1 NADH dehydrogenase [Mycobacterium kansasii]ARG68509.1 NADH dehydrogenase [Mycobacterium kansasii]ARG76851.1 NADH dehydrogenase [Mycobacterium kansasii]